MKIIIDGMGGDNAPQNVVQGTVNAVNGMEGFTVVLTGKEELIRAELAKYKYKPDRIEIVNCPDVVLDTDQPTHAIKTKTTSSMVVAFDLLKNDPDAVGMISGGNSGALLVGTIFKLGRIKGISRPVLGTLLATTEGADTEMILVDSGANTDCKPINLCHFAIMGSAIMECHHGIQNPKVALLSNGAEETKGNALGKETFPMLKNLEGINFVGNIEARDIFTGKGDVIVADGFDGNIAMKTAEGVSKIIVKFLKEEFMSKLRYKLAAGVLKPAFKTVMKKIDYNERGGALILGAKKLVTKVHGLTAHTAYTASIYQTKKMHENNLTGKIEEKLLKAVSLAGSSEE